MKTMNKKTILIASITLVVGLLAGWLIFGGNKSNSHEDHEHVKTEINGETVWTCSMHPQIRQNEPGDCPICGMDLIPLDDDQNADIDPDAISMSPTAMQLASVSTAIVGKTNPVKQVRLNGKVQFDERLVYSQSSHIPGRIEKLSVNFTGEFVSRGQTIAYIYSPELVTAQEELFEAQKIAESQPQLFTSAKEKLKNWKLSDKQIENILTSEKKQVEFPIQADVSGYVTSKMINLGDYVRKGETIYEITNLSKVWILFDVYESDINWIKKGDKVDFTIASFPGESFTGSITWLDPVINPKTRVAKARVEFNNSNGKLKPEMFASGVVETKLSNKSKAIVVPKTAIMWTGKRSVAYVKTNSDQGVNFIMREVSLGSALGDSYVIESGLMEGEEIAVNGTFSIDAAAQLAGKPSMMSPEGGQVMTGHNHGDIVVGVSESKEEEEVKPKKDISQHLSINKQAKETLQPLYDSYLKWKDALTNDNFAEAQKMATNLKSALDKINMSLFTGDAHNVWMEYQGSLNNSLEHVQHFSDIEQLRKSFQTVSSTIIEMTNKFTPLSKTIYVQHCPMADNNKGADWLSTEKEIRNPYFGSSMLTCGEITKEIK
ncbi:MAG: efflux transporter periplasmic adaptor subunit [Bacteroidetes bacterium GWF2_33_16]|nr:MAG: efflux transporter periplasmic adaptor subunit [Bacteroidetes bacterium GWE2_32_14]OFY06075.1 MAG: efflux transporter periplasmic adaptor subunit [Bacteroidetes bacterium GWF2_33_16]